MKRHVWSSLLALALTIGCSKEKVEPIDPATLARVHAVTSEDDEKARLYNLIGRWFPTEEAKRLSDVTLTPEEWCKRPPVTVSVLPDQISIACSDTVVHEAAIALVKTSTRAGEISLALRAPKTSPLKAVRFEDVHGPTAVIAGNPCYGGEPTPHQRFPEYEILTRQILGGRRCSQIIAGQR